MGPGIIQHCVWSWPKPFTEALSSFQAESHPSLPLGRELTSVFFQIHTSLPLNVASHKSAFSVSHSAHPFLAWASVAYSAVHVVATGLMAWVQLGYMFVPTSVGLDVRMSHLDVT